MAIGRIEGRNRVRWNLLTPMGPYILSSTVSCPCLRRCLNFQSHDRNLRLVLLIGASLSEPHMVVSTAALSIILCLYIWYVRTSFRIPASFYFYAKSLKLCNYAIQPGRPGNEAKYAIQHDKCGRLWERG